ncbi:MAG: tyrosine-type recombinase/integrase [Anaerolineales bacterium]
MSGGVRGGGLPPPPTRFPLKASGGATLMARLSRKSEVHITFHKCRRTFATWALRSGIDLLSLQRLLGHTSLEMVRKYAQQDENDLHLAHNKSGPVDNYL